MTINRRNTIFALAAAIWTPHALMAQEDNAAQARQILNYANTPHIAYIQTTDARVNTTSLNGMRALQAFMDKKTSLRPDEEIVGLDLENDTLIPFKFIYWPILEGDQPFSEDVQQKVQDFIQARKVILFDNRTREPDNEKVLRRVLGDVNFGLMEPMGEDHPLTSVFYNVTNLPGNMNFTPVDVQVRNASVSESVSSIIIGQRDWARAWSGIGVDKKGQETALRAAANTVLYAYIGNYKVDQATIDQSLDRINE